MASNVRMAAAAGLIVMAFSTIGASAQLTPATPPPPPPAAATTATYDALLAQGFEIKNVLFIAAGASARLDNAVVGDTVLVSLQHGANSATCWVTFSLWNGHAMKGVACNILH